MRQAWSFHYLNSSPFFGKSFFEFVGRFACYYACVCVFQLAIWGARFICYVKRSSGVGGKRENIDFSVTTPHSFPPLKRSKNSWWTFPLFHIKIDGISRCVSVCAHRNVWVKEREMDILFKHLMKFYRILNWFLNSFSQIAWEDFWLKIENKHENIFL